MKLSRFNRTTWAFAFLLSTPALGGNLFGEPPATPPQSLQEQIDYLVSSGDQGEEYDIRRLLALLENQLREEANTLNAQEAMPPLSTLSNSALLTKLFEAQEALDGWLKEHAKRMLTAQEGVISGQYKGRLSVGEVRSEIQADDRRLFEAAFILKSAKELLDQVDSRLQKGNCRLISIAPFYSDAITANLRKELAKAKTAIDLKTYAKTYKNFLEKVEKIRALNAELTRRLAALALNEQEEREADRLISLGRKTYIRIHTVNFSSLGLAQEFHWYCDSDLYFLNKKSQKTFFETDPKKWKEFGLIVDRDTVVIE